MTLLAELTYISNFLLIHTITMKRKTILEVPKPLMQRLGASANSI
jgi:hypothetical protein